MKKMKKALITGITGQTGSHLADLLLSKQYEVHGMIRRSSSFNTDRIAHIYDNPNLTLHYGDLTDASSTHSLIEKIRPEEIYNLGAQSHVRVSFDIPIYTAQSIVIGTLNLLEAIRSIDANIKMYQASSSEMFGKVVETPQTETTPFYPRSPYAVSKLAAYWYSKNYREAYDMFVCNGILFNHEGPRRGETFVTRKITRAAARIKLGLQSKLYLGNLSTKRDWGYAGDYVQAMWLMLQYNKPDDYVISTGITHSIQYFLTLVFKKLDLNWRDYVVIDDKYKRPAEVDLLLGDSTKAWTILGWSPKTTLEQLIDIMIENDLKLAKLEKLQNETN